MRCSMSPAGTRGPRYSTPLGSRNRRGADGSKRCRRRVRCCNPMRRCSRGRPGRSFRSRHCSRRCPKGGTSHRSNSRYSSRGRMGRSLLRARDCRRRRSSRSLRAFRHRLPAGSRPGTSARTRRTARSREEAGRRRTAKRERSSWSLPHGGWPEITESVNNYPGGRPHTERTLRKTDSGNCTRIGPRSGSSQRRVSWMWSRAMAVQPAVGLFGPRQTWRKHTSLNPSGSRAHFAERQRPS